MRKLDKIVRKPHLSTLVASSISREIAEGRLNPNDQLPTEQSLSNTFGVSRNVIREAIARLRSEGRIWSEQGRGAFVSDAASGSVLKIDFDVPGDDEGFRSLFEFRGIVEVQSAALAAARRSDRDIAAIGAALDGMAASPYGSVKWLNGDLAFHAAVAVAAGNGYVEKFLSEISPYVRESILASGHRSRSDDVASATVAEHCAILAAIGEGDRTAAVVAMRAHLDEAALRVGLEDVVTSHV